MVICKETKILNFLLTCFKQLKTFVELIIEFDLNLTTGSTIKPDLFGYFFHNSNYYYSLFEYKQINVFPIPNDEWDRILSQCNNYISFKTKDIDATLMPKNLDVKIFINYFFFDSNFDSIKYVLEQIPFTTEIYALNADLSNYTLNYIKAQSNNENHDLLNQIIILSRNRENWRKIYIPFTLKDIEDISGEGGNRINVTRISGSLIINSFMAFIISRKIKNQSTTFYSDDFISYVFNESYDNLNIGREMRQALTRKIRLFLNYLIDHLFNEIKIEPILKRTDTNKFQILLRKTNTLLSRYEEIKERVIKYFSQKKITEYFT
jgi:hypothetical protein